MSQKKKIEFEGMEVSVFRDPKDGMLTIDVGTDDVATKDNFPGFDVPRLRLIVNECHEVTDARGAWIKDPREELCESQ